MSVEGGAFRCDIHLDRNGKGFTTTSISEFNDHCKNTEGHREEGQLICSGCGELFMWSMPFKPLDTDGSKGIGNLKIMCNDCNPKQDKEIKVIKVQQQKQGAKKK